jgi:hypothetical protein
MSMTVFQILEALSATSSRNEKINIIKAEKNHQLLKDTFKYALDPFNIYGIKVIPTYAHTGQDGTTLQNFIDYLPNFIERKITGNAAIDKLREMLADMTHEDSTVAEFIIRKDLRCGVQASTVNKIWKDLIFSYPCLLGKSFDPDTIDKHMTWPAIAQLKLDGLRVNAIVDPATKKVLLFTRAGKPIEIHNELDDDLLALNSNSDKAVMYDGELLVVDKQGNVLPRKAGNGILNKAIRGTISTEEASRVRIQLWDRIPIEDFYAKQSKEIYSERFGKLLIDADLQPDETTMAMLAQGGHKYKIVDFRYVDNLEQAQEYYQEALANGEEGIMLKTVTHLWQDKRSNELVKFKCEKLCELRVVGWEEGTGQFEGYLGKLPCVSECGKLEVNIGGGFSRDFRLNTRPEDIVNKIITVKFNEVIESEDKPGKYSLFLGRCIEVREDKDLADDLETILATKTVK